jgi:hypothetical protein
MSDRWKVRMQGLPPVAYQFHHYPPQMVSEITVYASSYQDATYELEAYCERYGVPRTEATFLRQ